MVKSRGFAGYTGDLNEPKIFNFTTLAVVGDSIARSDQDSWLSSEKRIRGYREKAVEPLHADIASGCRHSSQSTYLAWTKGRR